VTFHVPNFVFASKTNFRGISGHRKNHIFSVRAHPGFFSLEAGEKLFIIFCEAKRTYHAQVASAKTREQEGA